MREDLFTKSYDLVEQNFDEDDLVNDLNRYIDSYRKIVNDPASSGLLDVLDESVFDETDQKKKAILIMNCRTLIQLLLNLNQMTKQKEKRNFSIQKTQHSIKKSWRCWGEIRI